MKPEMRTEESTHRHSRTKDLFFKYCLHGSNEKTGLFTQYAFVFYPRKGCIEHENRKTGHQFVKNQIGCSVFLCVPGIYFIRSNAIRGE